MNGFFAVLVARAEGRLPVLERRARSLFEPDAGVVAGPMNRAVTQSAGEAVDPQPTERRQHESTRPQRIQRSPVDTPDTTSVGAESVPRPASPRPETSFIQPVRTAHLSNDASAVLDRERAALDAHRSAERPATAAFDAPRTRASASYSPVDRIAPTAPPDTPRRKADRLVAEDDSDGARRSTNSPRRDTGLLEARQSAASRSAVLIAKVQAPAVIRREASAAGATAQAPPAPVQISIGRVEIRAVPGTAATKARSVGPAAPKLSLDDYLRSRNETAR